MGFDTQHTADLPVQSIEEVKTDIVLDIRALTNDAKVAMTLKDERIAELELALKEVKQELIGLIEGS